MARELPAAIIDRLCGHMQTGAFNAGAKYDFLNLDFDDYRHRFADGDETVVFVLLAEASKVVGFVAIRDLVIPKADKRYLSIPAAAVAEDWAGGNAGLRLIAKALTVGHIRNEAHHTDTGRVRYDGIACVPWTDELQLVLDRQNFVPLEGTYWWVRPFNRKRRRNAD